MISLTLAIILLSYPASSCRKIHQQYQSVIVCLHMKQRYNDDTKFSMWLIQNLSWGSLLLTILHSGRETILGTRKGNEWDVFYFNIKYLSYAKKKKKKKKG